MYVYICVCTSISHHELIHVYIMSHDISHHELIIIYYDIL